MVAETTACQSIYSLGAKADRLTCSWRVEQWFLTGKALSQLFIAPR